MQEGKRNKKFPTAALRAVSGTLPLRIFVYHADVLSLWGMTCYANREQSEDDRDCGKSVARVRAERHMVRMRLPPARTQAGLKAGEKKQPLPVCCTTMDRYLLQTAEKR